MKTTPTQKKLIVLLRSLGIEKPKGTRWKDFLTRRMHLLWMQGDNTDVVKRFLIDNTSFLPKNSRLVDRWLHIKGGLTELNKCGTCSKPVLTAYRGKLREYCSTKCMTNNPTVKERQVATFQENYGVDNPFQSEVVKQKMRRTWVENYGVDNPNKSRKVRKGTERTNIQRYGVDNPLKNEVVRSKMRATKLEIYGDEHNQSKSQKKQRCATNMERYGVSCNLAIADKTGSRSKGGIKFVRQVSREFKLRGVVPEYRIPDTKYTVDGYHAGTKTILEYDGDFWHGNPSIYSPRKINIMTGTSFQSLHKKTVMRRKELLKAGYRVIHSWESDFHEGKPAIVQAYKNWRDLYE